jgi:hypothetical protein
MAESIECKGCIHSLGTGNGRHTVEEIQVNKGVSIDPMRLRIIADFHNN